MVSLRTSGSQQVSGPRRSVCREGRSPYNCCSNPGTNNRRLVMKLNASTWLAGQWAAPMHGPTPLLPAPPQEHALLHSEGTSAGLRLAAPSPCSLWQASLRHGGNSGSGTSINRERRGLEVTAINGHTWAPAIPSWQIRSRQGVQQSVPEPQPLQDSQWVCFTNEGAPVGPARRGESPCRALTPQVLLSTLGSKGPARPELQAAMARQQDLNWPHGQKRPKDPPYKTG